MGLTRASRTQLAEVEVVFNEGQHTRQEQPPLPVVQLVRLHADGAQEDLHPFLLSESLASLFQFLNVHMGHLDRRQLMDMDRGSVLFFLDILIVKLDNTPDTAAEQPVKFGGVFLRDRDSFDAEIGKLGFVAVLFYVQVYGDLVNDRIAAALAQHGEDFLCLVWPHIIVR